MLVYNKTDLDNWNNRQMTEEAADLGLITAAEKQEVLSKFPSRFFTPTTIVRIGLGFATSVAIGTFFGFVILILSMNSEFFLLSFVFGAGCIYLLEYMIRQKHNYRSGIDDVLLYQAYVFMMGAVVDLLDRAPDPSIPISFTAMIFALAATIRYADRLMAALSLMMFILFVYFVLDKINSESWLAMPLIALVICVLGWFAATKMLANPKFIYYRHCIEFFQLCCLVIAGLSANYFMITENWFKIQYYQQGIDDAWKVLYIGLNIIVPLVVILSGIRARHKMRIRMGILMVVAGVATFHYYLTDTPSEILCIIYGAILLVISYWLLKHYRAKENGISFAERYDGQNLFELESLLVGAGVSMVFPKQAAKRFGGGDFGGGGAGGEY